MCMRSFLKIRWAFAAILLIGSAGTAQGKARQVNEFHWEGVERVVAIGDIHGDYDQFLKALETAGLIDRKGKWSGGATHLVQTGDVPDRGPDTREIMDFLEKLKKAAKRKGGRVHTLIGNHEAMNVYGDLRYVTPGEFEAFEDRNSKRFQDALWEQYLQSFQARDPEGFAALDLESHRATWEKQYPLGWNEHRLAWSSQGEYGKQVMENPVVLKINDTLFLHGGLSAKYCELSLAELTSQVHAGMANYNYEDPGIVEDAFGPLWYRGLATDSEAKRASMVDALLARYGASRIVVGHTPTQGVVWPRFDGKVVLNDVGLAGYYGGYVALLELGGGGPVAHYPNGKQLPLPENDAGRIEYLKAVVALNPGNAHLQSRLQKMLMANGAPADTGPAPAEAAMSEEEAARVALEESWLSPDNCR